MSNFLLALIVAASSLGWSGLCTSVHDGDTVTVVRDGAPYTIRLQGIDCPEGNEPYSAQAKAFTSRMILGKTVEVVPVAEDRYGRTMAWIKVDGKSLNHELIRAGCAWWIRSGAAPEKKLVDLETEAHRNKRGLWAHFRTMPAWYFKRTQRKLWRTDLPSDRPAMR